MENAFLRRLSRRQSEQSRVVEELNQRLTRTSGFLDNLLESSTEHAIVVIDNSLSMSYRTLEGSLLTQAKQAAVKLVARLLEVQHLLRQRGGNVLAQILHCLVHRRPPLPVICRPICQRRIVALRLIFFCSWITPNNRASAVGGHPGT